MGASEVVSSAQTRGEWRLWQRNALPRDWWPRWDALNSAGDRGLPILDARFACAALEHFGVDETFAEFNDSHGTRIMAILQRLSRVRWSVFQPSQAPLPLLVHAPGIQDGAALLSRLLPRLSPFCLALDLRCQDLRHSPLNLERPAAMLDRQIYGTTIAVARDGGFETYWEARPKGLKQNIGRHFRRMEREGLAWRFDVVSDSAAMDDIVRQYGRLESAGWKGEAGSAVHPNNEQGRFYHDLLRSFAATSDARVYLLKVGGRLAAARLTIRGHGVVVMLKTSFDKTLAPHAPGRLITYLTLQDMLGDPAVERIEFYTKANRDALEWASEQRDLSAATLFRHPVLMRAARARRSARSRKSS